MLPAVEGILSAVRARGRRWRFLFITIKRRVAFIHSAHTAAAPRRSYTRARVFTFFFLFLFHFVLYIIIIPDHKSRPVVYANARERARAPSRHASCTRRVTLFGRRDRNIIISRHCAGEGTRGDPRGTGARNLTPTGRRGGGLIKPEASRRGGDGCN